MEHRGLRGSKRAANRAPSQWELQKSNKKAAMEHRRFSVESVRLPMFYFA
ncbi:MAG: hypothetical protein SOR89_00135 [Ndongobacter sp.]|nr:hypothetical protein [Ndongobacter sp.]